MTSLLLIGASGVGKTAIAAQLQERGWLSADIDQAVSHRLGRSEISAYVDISTAQRRQVEQQIFQELVSQVLAQQPEHCVIAASSGLFGSDPEDIALAIPLQQWRDYGGKVVCLTAELGAMVTRLGLANSQLGGLVLPRRELRVQLEKRSEIYQKLADLEFDTTHTTPAHAASELQQLG
ncbi:MAG: shikimate kinase [Trueperella sp.]|nr:shikimate kinase [Trueperella sp.]